MPKNYSIFISYRRRDAGDKAEHLYNLLDLYYKDRISFDRENLTGKFNVQLIDRIDHVQDFILVLEKGSLQYKDKDRSDESVAFYNELTGLSQDDFAKRIDELGPNAEIDYVRIEIGRALRRKDLHIIPVVPERNDSYNFASLNLPSDIAPVKGYEAVFYSDSPDALFKDVVPKVRKHLKSKPDFVHKGKLIASIIIVLLGILASTLGWHHYQTSKAEEARLALMDSICEQYAKYNPNFNPDIPMDKLVAIRDILSKMEPVEGGTYMMGPSPQAHADDVEPDLETPPTSQTVGSFYMDRYEVTVGQWSHVMGLEYDEKAAEMPMTNISFTDCVAFCDSLYNLSGIRFNLPTEAEWEYAARGGINPDGTLYAGSDQLNEVAWYKANSNGKPHVCDASNSRMECNALNLFDMSGNVSEWCLWTDSIHRLYSDMASQKVTSSDVIYNQGVCIIRGGNYLSEPYELTVFHRDTADKTQKSPNIGLRIIIKNK